MYDAVVYFLFVGWLAGVALAVYLAVLAYRFFTGGDSRG